MDATVTLQAIRTALNAKFFKREEEIDGILVAVLAGENVFLLGKPGTAKSLLTETISACFADSKYFGWLMNKFTTPEDIFGPVSIKEYKENDRYIRNTNGKLPQANIIFLDEIFKASSAIINTLLTVFNEKTFYNDGKAEKLDIISSFAASNEIPNTSGSQELAAIWDRLVIRYIVKHTNSPNDMKDLFKSCKTQVQIPQLSRQDLNTMQSLVNGVNCPESVMDKVYQIVFDVRNEGIYISDRRWLKFNKLLKAHAFLNGRSEVNDDDIEFLKHCLWETPEQVKQVAKIVMKVANPLADQILEIRDAIDDLVENFNKDPKKNSVFELLKGFTSLKEKLEKMAVISPNNRHLQDCQKYLMGLIAQYAQKAGLKSL